MWKLNTKINTRLASLLCETKFLLQRVMKIAELIMLDLQLINLNGIELKAEDEKLLSLPTNISTSVMFMSICIHALAF